MSISGAFAVTFSIVFAYVSDITSDADRSAAYGQASHCMHNQFPGNPEYQVSATFAASLVVSPALGSLVQSVYGTNSVYALATAVATLDVIYIALYVPEVD